MNKIQDRKRTLWRNSSSEHIIASGTFSAYHALKLVTKDGKRGEKSQTFIKCAGSKGKFSSLPAFCDQHLCENCPESLGLLPKYDMNINVLNMIAPVQERRSYHSVKVPCGCPHSSLSNDMQTNQSGALARSVTLRNGIMTSPRLHSWRLTLNGNKLTLSIQYIAFFANMNSGKTKEEAFYRHITADINTGQTYISNIHNKHHTYNKHAAYKTTIDTITYSGLPLDFLIEDKHCTDNVAELSIPLSIMCDKLKDILRCMGYAPVATDRSVNVFSWRSRRHRNGFDGEEASPQDLIYDIARINRFPHLPRYPIADRVAPIQMRRDADALPRDTRPETLAEHAGFDEPLIVDALALHPDQLLAAMLLRSIGCDDPIAISYAVHHKFASALADISRSIMADQTMNHDVYDIVGLALVSAIDEGGWNQLVRRLCDKEISCRDLVVRYQKELHDADIPLLYPLSPQRNTDTFLPPDDGDYQSFLKQPFDQDYRSAVLELTGHAVATHTTHFPHLPSSFQKQGTKWQFAETFTNETNNTKRLFTVTAKSGKSPRVAVADVYLTCGCSLDRRKWNQATSKKYAVLIQELRTLSRTISPNCCLSEFMCATPEQQTALGGLYKQLVNYREKLSTAWTLSIARFKSITYKFDITLNEEHKNALLNAISVWMEKNKIETTRETKMLLRPVEKIHKRRVNNQKKKTK